MKEHLLEAFRYNEWANKKLIESITALPQKDEALALFTHMIRAQEKWYNRVFKSVDDSSMDGWLPLIPVGDLAQEWEKSVGKWISLVEQSDEEDLDSYIEFTKVSDGKKAKLRLKELMLQINYHAVHHRAQINTIISKQGHKVPLTDYIYTVIQQV